jgi:hypothetical protein
VSWLSSLIHPSNPAADAAAAQTAQLAKQQQAHDAAVSAGKANIDSAVAQFSDPYFAGVAKSYRDVYNPQLTDQYNTSRDQLTALLAGTDTLGSSVGNNAQAQLEKQRAVQQGNIANQGQDVANNMRAQVGNAKTNLYSMNANAADPLAAAVQSQAQAGAIVAPQAYPTLSNTFASVLSPFASAFKTNSQSTNPIYNAPNANPNAAPPSGNGSAIYSNT